MKDTLEQNQLINEYGHTFTKAQQNTQQDTFFNKGEHMGRTIKHGIVSTSD